MHPSALTRVELQSNWTLTSPSSVYPPIARPAPPRSNLQQQQMSLLQRKGSWGSADVERFAVLCRQEHEAGVAVAQAKVGVDRSPVKRVRHVLDYASSAAIGVSSYVPRRRGGGVGQGLRRGVRGVLCCAAEEPGSLTLGRLRLEEGACRGCFVSNIHRKGNVEQLA